ncbi:MAG: NADH-quinone oxidoreductase subunit H [Peptococcaceae bacterium]|jgi:formate hydrogenlyase subunit 4|nr:NADH-quinone oxidoreductase subunit H [Peptococcaceae bacterium]
MNTLSYILIQCGVILLTAPLVNGLIRKVKAWSQKRRGAPVWQMYADLYKLIRKGTVVSDVSSWVFKATPYLVFATALSAALLVPISIRIQPALLPGDFIMLVSILALGRFFLMTAALDTASTFGGMGSSREALISSLIEPSIMVSLITLALLSHTTSLSAMMGSMQLLRLPLIHPAFLAVFLAWMIILLAETARLPIDDPATHLELTMVHEAMLLEYSGRHLALMEYGAALKQLVLITLIVNLFFPHDQWIPMAGIAGIGLSITIYVFKVILFALLIGWIEVNTVKLKLFSIPNLAALAFILSFLGILQYLIVGGA